MSWRCFIEIPGLPPMTNPSGRASTHWRSYHREATTWRNTAAAYARKCAKPLPPAPLKRVHLVLVRFSATEPDFDGLVRGFKHIVDGLVQAGILANDKLSNTGPWDCRWQRARQNEGKIQVWVEEAGHDAPEIDPKQMDLEHDFLNEEIV